MRQLDDERLGALFDVLFVDGTGNRRLRWRRQRSRGFGRDWRLMGYGVNLGRQALFESGSAGIAVGPPLQKRRREGLENPRLVRKTLIEANRRALGSLGAQSGSAKPAADRP